MANLTPLNALRSLVSAIDAPRAFDFIQQAPTKRKDQKTGKLRLHEGAVDVVIGQVLAAAIANAKRTLEDPPRPPPIPMLLHCPECGERHIDEDGWEHRPHRDHACQACGHVWRPAHVDTVGVRFLPGYKNGDGVKLVPRSKRPHAVDRLTGAELDPAEPIRPLSGAELGRAMGLAGRSVSIEDRIRNALERADGKRIVLKAKGHKLPVIGTRAGRERIVASLSNHAMRDFERAVLVVAKLDCDPPYVSMLFPDGKEIHWDLPDGAL